MGKFIKYYNLLIIILSLSLVGADYELIDYSFCHNITTTQCECSDISNNNLHSDNFEDDNFLHDSKVKSTKLPDHIEIVSSLNDHFNKCFINNIWQPPKFS